MIRRMTMRTPVRAALPCVVTLLVAGCGGGTKTVTVPAPASTTAETTSIPTTETTPPADTTSTQAPATGADDPTRQDPITVKGKEGDTLTLLGQYATGMSGKPKPRIKIEATLTGQKGPFSGFDLAKGHKLIGMTVRVKNVGDKTFSDPLPSGTLILVGGENGKQTNLITSGDSPCDNPRLKLRTGESKEVCIAFDVPTNAKLETFQFETDSGYGDTGLWRLG